MAHIKSTIKHLLVVIWFLFSITFGYNEAYGQQQQAPVDQPAIKTKISIPNLPPQHYQFWLKNHPRAFKEFQLICSQTPHPLTIRDSNYFQLLHTNLSMEDPRYLNDLDYGKTVLNKICSKIGIIMKSCWGYESNCQIIHLMPECLGSKMSQAKDEQEQKITWFSQGDFGYILERRREMSKYCSPDKYSNHSVKSYLECSKHFKTCRGENLMMKFPDQFPRDGSLILDKKHSRDLIKPGNVGGWNCDLQLKRIQEEGGQSGVLQSWFNELKHYNLIQGPHQLKDACDIVIDKPAFIIKLDSPSNMYHYFCNFLNLYATIHLNNRFSKDNQIIIWDNHFPRSSFEVMWQVFSNNPVMHIGQFESKRVCLKKFIFTLLPRMVDGLYYNTPLIPGCSKTGLFDAFNKHVLHNLHTPQIYDLDRHKKADNKLIRVTILSRATQHRRILNQEELKSALVNKSSDYKVELVDQSGRDFRQQLLITQNTDILIGVHGAGLTHTLFLPNWAALFELHDCGDSCYYDLARLRGVSYFTLRDKEKFVKKVPVEDGDELKRLEQSKLVDHDKFSNYKVDVTEFLNIFERIVDKVRNNRAKHFQALQAEEEEEEEKQHSMKEEVETTLMQVDDRKSEQEQTQQKQPESSSSNSHIEL